MTGCRDLRSMLERMSLTTYAARRATFWNGKGHNCPEIRWMETLGGTVCGLSEKAEVYKKAHEIKHFWCAWRNIYFLQIKDSQKRYIWKFFQSKLNILEFNWKKFIIKNVFTWSASVDVQVRSKKLMMTGRLSRSVDGRIWMTDSLTFTNKTSLN